MAPGTPVQGDARPPAIYIIDLFAAERDGAAQLMALLQPLLQSSSITKVLHDGRMVGGIIAN